MYTQCVCAVVVEAKATAVDLERLSQQLGEAGAVAEGAQSGPCHPRHPVTCASALAASGGGT